MSYSIDPNEVSKYREAVRAVQAGEQETLMRHAEQEEERIKNTVWDMNKFYREFWYGTDETAPIWVYLVAFGTIFSVVWFFGIRNG